MNRIFQFGESDAGGVPERAAPAAGRLRIALTGLCTALGLAIVSWTIVTLEKRRDEKLAEKTVRLGESVAGRIFSAEFTGVLSGRDWDVAARIPTIRTLRFTNAVFTEDGLSPATRFPELSEINISSCPVGDRVLAPLQQLERLQTLWLRDLAVTDSTVENHLCRIPNLRNLSLIDCPITDEAIDALICMRSLRRLNLSETQLPFSEIERLRLTRTDLTLFVDAGTDYPTLLALPSYSQDSQHADLPTGPLYSLSSGCPPDRLRRFLKLPHNWVTGEASNDWKSNTVEARLGANAVMTLPELITHFDRLRFLQIPADALAKIQPAQLVGIVRLELTNVDAATSLKELETLNNLNELVLHTAGPLTKSQLDVLRIQGFREVDVLHPRVFKRPNTTVRQPFI